MKCQLACNKFTNNNNQAKTYCVFSSFALAIFGFLQFQIFWQQFQIPLATIGKEEMHEIP
jgi:hypothetical protein